MTNKLRNANKLVKNKTCRLLRSVSNNFPTAAVEPHRSEASKTKM